MVSDPFLQNAVWNLGFRPFPPKCALKPGFQTSFLMWSETWISDPSSKMWFETSVSNRFLQNVVWIGFRPLSSKMWSETWFQTLSSKKWSETYISHPFPPKCGIKPKCQTPFLQTVVWHEPTFQTPLLQNRLPNLGFRPLSCQCALKPRFQTPFLQNVVWNLGFTPFCTSSTSTVCIEHGVISGGGAALMLPNLLCISHAVEPLWCNDGGSAVHKHHKFDKYNLFFSPHSEANVHAHQNRRGSRGHSRWRNYLHSARLTRTISAEGRTRNTRKRNYTCISPLPHARSSQRVAPGHTHKRNFTCVSRLRHARSPQRVGLHGALSAGSAPHLQRIEKKDVKMWEDVSKSDVRRCRMWEDVRCKKMSDARRCGKISDVRRCEKMSDVRRCEKMSDVRRCEMWEDEKISDIVRSLCRSIYVVIPPFWWTLRRSDALGKKKEVRIDLHLRGSSDLLISPHLLTSDALSRCHLSHIWLVTSDPLAVLETQKYLLISSHIWHFLTSSHIWYLLACPHIWHHLTSS